MPPCCYLLIFLPYLHTLLCVLILYRGFCTHPSLLHLWHTPGAFFPPRSSPPSLPIYPELCLVSVLRKYLLNCWLSLRFRVWAYKPGLWAGWFWAGLSGIWYESGIAAPRQLRTIIAVTGGCVWVYGKKGSPYAVLWLSNASVKDRGEEDEGWADTQRALEFWNLFWVKQVRRIRLVSWIENK